MNLRSRIRLFAWLPALGFASLGGRSASAADDLLIVEARVDHPTLHMAGVQVLISDDDDRDAAVTIRYRRVGDSAWIDGLPLLRVWPETVSVPVLPQFAGSVFDLEPGAAYEIELHAVDPDGLDQTIVLEATTRAVPADPAAPNFVAVDDVASLTSALSAAAPGDVITLADGNYAGAFFSINASGTPGAPIVLRGASQVGVVLDGQGCTGCNILEVYGSHVHVENMTFRGAERALRFQGDGATGNVARRLIVRDVIHGIGSRPNQSDFVVCDNDIEGRLVWPWTFDADATSHWDDRGIEVTGDGHVVCHNRLVGFGDPVVNKKTMSRSWDVYGNDIRDSFDGTELDESEGNARLIWNRFVNVMDPVSIQPVRGGPAYVLRNVILNAPEEQVKLKSLGGVDEPSGALIYHNTFVSPNLALNLQTPITQHNFVFANNLVVGPEQLAGSRTAEWTAALNGGSFDANGYYPDGGFWLGVVAGQNQTFDSFAEMQASGVVEQNGVLLMRPIFDQDFVGPADEMAPMDALDVTPAPASGAVDAALALSGVNARHIGAAADIGAIERGCDAPVFGPRPAGAEAETNLVDCSAMGAGGGGEGGNGNGGNASGGNGNGAGQAQGGDLAAGGAGADGSSSDDGCGCVLPGSSRAGSVGAALTFAAGLLLLATRRRVAR